MSTHAHDGQVAILPLLYVYIFIKKNKMKMTCSSPIKGKGLQAVGKAGENGWKTEEFFHFLSSSIFLFSGVINFFVICFRNLLNKMSVLFFNKSD